MDYKNFLVEIDDQIAIATFNRPKAMNALSKEVFHEFRDLLICLETNESVRVIILTGSGDKAFVAGADIRELQEMDSAAALAYSALGQDCFSLLENMAKIVIAAVNGFALGGGSELALSCDFIFASEKAKFGLPEVTLGVMPGFAGTQRLPKAVGLRLARELIYTGEMIDAKRAMEIGLVNRVFTPEALISETKKVAKKIIANSYSAILAAKKAVNNGHEIDLDRGCKLERNIFALVFNNKNAKEGIAAFLEKRAPKFE